MIRLPEEVLVFARLAAFGLIVGTVYWFAAYETAGTVLLLGFGAAAAFAAVLLWAKSRSSGAADEWPLGGEPGALPAPAYAPFHVGVGAGVVALGVAFSPLLVLTGLVVVVIGARYWLEAAMREADASAARDRPDRPRAGRVDDPG